MKDGLKCSCWAELNSVNSYTCVQVSVPGQKGFTKESNIFVPPLFELVTTVIKCFSKDR